MLINYYVQFLYGFRYTFALCSIINYNYPYRNIAEKHFITKKLQILLHIFLYHIRSKLCNFLTTNFL